MGLGENRMTDIDLTGKVALVTGAGVSLGRSYACALARYGATVYVNDLFPCGREDAPAESPTVDAITAAGGAAHWLPGDVSDYGDATRMIETVVTQQGRMDILVNNAGVNLAAPFGETDMADFERVIRVHLLGTTYMTRAAWPVMQKQEWGRVILTTSSSILGSATQAAYSAAKMGIFGLMTALGLEGEPLGIRVNAIAPCARAKDLEGGFREEFLRAMDPDIVAEAVVFLASDDAPQRRVLFAAGGGYSTLRIVDSGGVFLGPESDAACLRDRFAEIEAMSDPREYEIVTDHIGRFNPQLGLPDDIWNPGHEL